MELTRRDATAALAAVGATGGVALAARREGDRAEDEGTLDEESVRASMVAVATVVPECSRRRRRSVRQPLPRRAPHRVDARRRAPHGGQRTRRRRPIVARRADRGSLRERLRSAPPGGRRRHRRGGPGRTLAERVRYYVVNELLLALYASPTGGELVGLENPQGHPAGPRATNEARDERGKHRSNSRRERGCLRRRRRPRGRAGCRPTGRRPRGDRARCRPRFDPRTGSTVRNERSGRVTTAPMSGTWAGSATRTATPASGSTR